MNDEYLNFESCELLYTSLKTSSPQLEMQAEMLLMPSSRKESGVFSSIKKYRELFDKPEVLP
jgi:hypothetical protein